jgi:hypothetical protein
VDTPAGEFVRVLVYDTDHGHPKPMEALQAWLRERGINEMPFDADDVLVIAPCGRNKDSNWDRSVAVHVRDDQLRLLDIAAE